MATRYVSNTGNDTTGNGLTPGTPWRSIRKALVDSGAAGVDAAGSFGIILVDN